MEKDALSTYLFPKKTLNKLELVIVYLLQFSADKSIKFFSFLPCHKSINFEQRNTTPCCLKKTTLFAAVTTVKW